MYYRPHWNPYNESVSPGNKKYTFYHYCNVLLILLICLIIFRTLLRTLCYLSYLQSIIIMYLIMRVVVKNLCLPLNTLILFYYLFSDECCTNNPIDCSLLSDNVFSYRLRIYIKIFLSFLNDDESNRTMKVETYIQNFSFVIFLFCL